MRNIFIDTNVAIDLVLRRAPFYDDACKLFSLSANNLCILHVAPLTFSTMAYLLEKKFNVSESKSILRDFSTLVEITTLDATTVRDSLSNGNFEDVEDCMQYLSALNQQCDCIITRNKKDFQKTLIPVFTTQEFLDKSEYVFEF